jgi:hypothetical protein
MSSYKVPVTKNKFTLKFNFLNRYFKNSQILIFMYGHRTMSCSMSSNEPTDKQNMTNLIVDSAIFRRSLKVNKNQIHLHNAAFHNVKHFERFVI